MSDMITMSLNMKIVDSIDKAPNYGDDVIPIRMDTAIIVRNGTQGGRSTVDLQCVDDKGKKYLIMVTGAILRNLSIMIGDEG